MHCSCSMADDKCIHTAKLLETSISHCGGAIDCSCITFYVLFSKGTGKNVPARLALDFSVFDCYKTENFCLKEKVLINIKMYATEKFKCCSTVIN